LGFGVRKPNQWPIYLFPKTTIRLIHIDNTLNKKSCQ
jgi:hypothetical protein